MIYYIINERARLQRQSGVYLSAVLQSAFKQKVVLTVAKRDMAKIEKMNSISQPSVSVSNAECEESQSCILFA